MIIKNRQILASAGHKKTATHIFSGPQNEKITPLQGNAMMMQDMMNDARESGLKYGFHHFKISPDKTISRDDAYEDFHAIADEYGFDLSDAVIVEHRKQRATPANSDTHWHLIAPHLNPQTGRALNMRNNYKRDEKLSRLSEIRTGQKIIEGKHSRAVFHQLMDEGKTKEADAVKHTISIEIPKSSYSENGRRKAENAGINLPKSKTEILDIWKQSDNLKSFISGLRHNGYDFKEGIRKNTFIIEKNGELIGSANRLLKVKKADFLKMYDEMKREANHEHMEPENVALEEGNRHNERHEEISEKARTEGNEGIKHESPDETKKATTDPGKETRDRKKTERNRGTGNHPANIAGGEDGHITDFGPVNRQTRRQRPARPNPADFRFATNDSRTKQRDNQDAITHSESVIASAKIRKVGNRKPFKRAEKFTVITDEKLEEIRKKLKESKTENRAFYREQYKNIKDQKYHIDCFNKQIDSSVSLLLVDMFLRLFGYSLKKNKPTPVVTKPDVEPPVTREEFDMMTDREKQTVTWKSYGLYRSAYETYANVCKKHDVPHADFQGWLNDLGGDYMSEQIANLYPEIYMRELDKSANEHDRMASAELRKIWNGERTKYESQFGTVDGLKTHIEHAHGEIRNQIELEHENKALDAEVARVAQEYHQATKSPQSDPNQPPKHDTGNGLRIG